MSFRILVKSLWFYLCLSYFASLIQHILSLGVTFLNFSFEHKKAFLTNLTRSKISFRTFIWTPTSITIRNVNAVLPRHLFFHTYHMPNSTLKTWGSSLEPKSRPNQTSKSEINDLDQSYDRWDKESYFYESEVSSIS